MIAFLTEPFEQDDGDSRPIVMEFPAAFTNVGDMATSLKMTETSPGSLRKFHELAMLERALAECGLIQNDPNEKE
ncbi:MAG: hypothetical protein AAF958_07365 [Planctomycetota bacterium]